MYLLGKRRRKRISAFSGDFTLQCFPIKDTVREIENAEKEIGSIILINAVFFSLLYDHDKIGYYGIDRGECGVQSE